MLILLFCLFGAMLSLGIYLYCKNNYHNDGVYLGLNFIGGIGLGIVSILIISCCCMISSRPIIDEKIEMYQQENQSIQLEVASAVENYMKHESSTYKDVKAKSPITLATIFPELKSNELVAKQIDVYVSNNQKIKELKEEKLNNRVLAWWLYFGR